MIPPLILLWVIIDGVLLIDPGATDGVLCGVDRLLCGVDVLAIPSSFLPKFGIFGAFRSTVNNVG